MIIKPLNQLATWERVKPEKTYPKGTTLIQISATRGQIDYLTSPSKVDPKYAAINPLDEQQLHPRYLYHALTKTIPEFLTQYQTGLNLVPAEIKHLKIPLRPMQQQLQIISILEEIEKTTAQVEAEIKAHKNIKKTMLDHMFAKTHY